MLMSSSVMVQKALMKAEAKRLLVMRGTLRSMAARRILVAVGELVGGEVLGDVDHHVDLVAMEHVKGGGERLPNSLLSFAGPEDAGVLNAVLGEVSGGSSGGKEAVAMGSKHAGSVNHLGLLLG